MPIRPDLRWFYRRPAWKAARLRVLARAGGRFTLLGEYLGGAKCEECGREDGAIYTNLKTGRLVVVQLGTAHLDHEDLDRFYDDRNLRCLDRRCHLLQDLQFHRRTRQRRRDRNRPLIQLCESTSTLSLLPIRVKL
jgi:hypothetical protein